MWGPGDALVNETGSAPVLTALPRGGSGVMKADGAEGCASSGGQGFSSVAIASLRISAECLIHAERMIENPSVSSTLSPAC